MSRLIESIRIDEGQVCRLAYHQARIERSLFDLFGVAGRWRLADELARKNIPNTGLYKARMLYDQNEIEIEFEEYKMRDVKTLKLVEGGQIDYGYKWADRSAIEQLTKLRVDCDDILIVKNGLITDVSFANIAFRTPRGWVTPLDCLLRGTMRQFLIDIGEIKAERIHVEDILQFDSFKLINALLAWDAPEGHISNIH